jgi:hypothetical protein
MRDHLIARNIANRQYFWNTCGWVTEQRGARKYSESEARVAHGRMVKSGVRAMPIRITKR